MKQTRIPLLRGLSLLAVSAALLAIAAPCPAADAPPTRVVFLSGAGKDDGKLWDFFCTGGRNAGVWTHIRVPSCWEQAGFGAYEYGLEARPSKKNRTPPMADEHGLYRLNFPVPADWKGGEVRLCFDGVMTDASVKLNGVPAGPIHRGAFYRFDYDVTALIRTGDFNLLEVDVAKKSSDPTVNHAEREGDYWNFGGIFRPVTLEWRPARNIAHVAVDARADGTFSALVDLAGPASGAEQVELSVLDASGAPAGPAVRTAVAPGATQVRIGARFAAPALWTCETPHLYRASVTLVREGTALHRAETRFGFRTFEVRAGDGFYLNGVKIKLMGVCRHSFWPESARTLSREVNFEDVRIMKQANMTAVRMSHYPPDSDFLDACDELGLYVLDELGGWHGKYGTETGRQLVKEMVERDVNHPSILFWDNGNEGGFNTALDGEFDRWDPQHRDVLHPWTTFGNVTTNHYRNYQETVDFCSKPDIFFPTEFLHGMYDGGAGSGMEDFWDVMYHAPRCAGGIVWAYLDESVARTDRNGRLDSKDSWAPDGIVGPHREKEGSYYTLAQVWCPVQIEGGPSRIGDRLSFRLENRFDFTSLGRCTFEWRVAGGTSAVRRDATPPTSLAEGALKGPAVGPHQQGVLEFKLSPGALRALEPAGVAVPPAPMPSDTVLYLTARAPDGRTLWTWSWPWKYSPVVPLSEPKAIHAPEVVDAPEQVVVRRSDQELSFDRRTGMLSGVKAGGRTLSISNGPRLAAYLRQKKSFIDVSGSSALTGLTHRADAAETVVEAAYSGHLRRVSWHFPNQLSGYGIRVDYETAFEGPVDILGVEFDYPEARIRSKDWFGAGPYHVWRNRLKGTVIAGYSRAYNNTVPGDTWDYPEFKGFFSDWRWAAFTTDEGRFALGNPSNGSPYLGVYQPNDGRVEPILPMPKLGIGVYQVIPAMGSKQSTPDLLGPHSQTPVLSGIQRGSFTIQFGP